MLDGITALVTGASRGIGREIALTLADGGANVALAARSEKRFEVAEEIDTPERSLPVEMDVTDEQSVREGIASTVETFGGLDCVVNNAGISGPSAPVESVDRAAWDETLEVNVTGVFLVTKHATPHLRESDQGRLINIASITGKRPRPNRTPYAASKIAVIGLSRTLSAELGEDGVTVNTICPGATESPRIDRILEGYADEQGTTVEQAKRELFTENNHLGALVEMDDTSELVAFLASDRGKHITGQDINVDAGTIWF